MPDSLDGHAGHAFRASNAVLSNKRLTPLQRKQYRRAMLVDETKVGWSKKTLQLKAGETKAWIEQRAVINANAEQSRKYQAALEQRQLNLARKREQSGEGLPPARNVQAETVLDVERQITQAECAEADAWAAHYRACTLFDQTYAQQQARFAGERDNHLLAHLKAEAVATKRAAEQASQIATQASTLREGMPRLREQIVVVDDGEPGPHQQEQAEAAAAPEQNRAALFHHTLLKQPPTSLFEYDVLTRPGQLPTQKYVKELAIPQRYAIHRADLYTDPRWSGMSPHPKPLIPTKEPLYPTY